MAQSTEISPYKCEDLGLIPRTHVKRNPDIQIYNPRVWEILGFAGQSAEPVCEFKGRESCSTLPPNKNPKACEMA